MSVEINNESGSEVDESALATLGRFVLDDLRIDPLADLSVVIVDVDTMATLHQQWMDLPGPTDVMAFPMDGADAMTAHSGRVDPSAPPRTDSPMATMLGDVVLCPPVAAEQAKAAGHSTTAELHLLCTHGILHLLGYDHGDADEEAEMFALQTRLLAAWSTSSGVAPIHTPLAGTAGQSGDGEPARTTS